MQQTIKTAEQQISKLLLKLKNDKKFLSTNELISVLENTKIICEDEKVINIIMHSIKTLLKKDLKSKAKLTEREAEIIVLIGQGLQNAAIAKVLKLSKSTVETHRKNIRKKLKLKRSDNLYAFALIFSLQYQYSITDDNFEITR